MFDCPNCGKILKDNVDIYNESLKKQDMGILPVLPVCRTCKEAVRVSNISKGGNVIVLNGTCGSGKTAIAEILANKGFLAIDGDCAIQSLRHKKRTKHYEWNELIDEIACEIDILSVFCKDIVLSHIILPDDVSKYIDMFQIRNMRYKLFLLKPSYQTAVLRCQKRTCHTSITPEKWVKHFYDLLVFDDDSFITVDNTYINSQVTAEAILVNFYLNDRSNLY